MIGPEQAESVEGQCIQPCQEAAKQHQVWNGWRI